MVSGRVWVCGVFALVFACGESDGEKKAGGAGNAGTSSQAGRGGGAGSAGVNAGTSGSAGRTAGGAGLAGGAGKGGGSSGNGGAAGTASAGDAGDGGDAGQSSGPGGAGQSGAGGSTQGGAGGDSGGSAGTTGGTAGGGSGGAPFSYSECNRDEDCTLVQDCCTCNAVRSGETIDECPAVCIQSACARGGIAEADVVCVGGRCVLEKSCGVTPPTCLDPQPTCPDGHRLTTNGDCWGACVPAEDCLAVSSCDVCEDLDLTCATTNGALPRCVTTPSECAANPTCACMGVCNEDAPCGDPNSEELACVCETC